MRKRVLHDGEWLRHLPDRMQRLHFYNFVLLQQLRERILFIWKQLQSVHFSMLELLRKLDLHILCFRLFSEWKYLFELLRGMQQLLVWVKLQCVLIILSPSIECLRCVSFELPSLFLINYLYNLQCKLLSLWWKLHQLCFSMFSLQC